MKRKIRERERNKTQESWVMQIKDCCSPLSDQCSASFWVAPGQLSPQFMHWGFGLEDLFGQLCSSGAPSLCLACECCWILWNLLGFTQITGNMMINMCNQGLPGSSLLQHLVQLSEQWLVGCRREYGADGGMSPNFITRERKPKGLSEGWHKFIIRLSQDCPALKFWVLELLFCSETCTVSMVSAAAWLCLAGSWGRGNPAVLPIISHLHFSIEQVCCVRKGGRSVEMEGVLLKLYIIFSISL